MICLSTSCSSVFQKIFFTAIGLFLCIFSIQGQNDEQKLTDLKHHIEQSSKYSNTFTQRDSSYYHAKQAELIALKLNEDSLLYESRSLMAYYFRITNDLEESLRLNRLMKPYINNQKDQTFKIRGYLDLANIYTYPSLYDSDSIVKYATMALEYSIDSNDAVHAIVSTSTLINHYLNIGENDKEIEMLMNQVSPFELVDEESRSMYKILHANHAEYLIKKERYLQAIQILNPLTSLSENNDDYGFTGHICRIIADAHAGSKQYKQAFKFRKKAAELQDEFYNREKESISQEMVVYFETREKEEAISKLELQKKEDSLVAKRTRKTLLTFVGGLSLLGLILLFSLNTYRKKNKADKALIALQKKVDESKTKMITNLTHEFKTPLTVMQGMLHEINGYDDVKNIIRRNGNQLLDLINQMLSLAKAEAGLLKIDNKQSDVVPFFNMLLESTHILAQNKNISFDVDIHPASIVMDFDTQVFRHIMTNLLSNAIKFTPNGGQIFIKINTENDLFNFSVRDTGIGMTIEDQQNIFDRFYQSERGKKEFSGGTGIGLSLVKELVTNLNGKLEIISMLGEGSTFTVRVPVTNSAPKINRTKIPENKPNSSAKNTSSASDKTILIIEDNVDVRHYISSCLRGLYHIQIAENGKQGFELAKHIVPDLIIIDYMMPIMDGVETIMLLKKDVVTDHIPVIMLTAKSSDQSRLSGLEAGVNAYLTKPFEPIILKTQVRNMLLHVEQVIKKKDPIEDQQHIKSYPFLEQLQAILSENYQDSRLSVEEISTSLGLSRMQAYRKLKSISDMSMSKYINVYRLKKAESFLATGRYNVSEVAYEVGYTDPSYFSKLYKEYFGANPSEHLSN